MYEQFYGLSAKPFELRPDPNFFFGSKEHRRAASYLEYGLSKKEGFIVITGEIGAGKSTLLRNLLLKLPSKNIIVALIVNTNLNSDDFLRMTVAAFGLPHEHATKTTLLTRFEQFLRECDRLEKHALLIVDEAQNLNPKSLEELRMLSNIQTEDRSLLQTFLVAQPEFRNTLHRKDMKQLQQRVIAAYHLGPMDAAETQSYIEHRLTTAGWRGDPSFSDDAYAAIYEFSGGIPRKINTLCDRLLLNGFLEDKHFFGKTEVNVVTNDIKQELVLPYAKSILNNQSIVKNDDGTINIPISLENFDNRLSMHERSVVHIMNALRQLVPRRTPPTVKKSKAKAKK